MGWCPVYTSSLAYLRSSPCDRGWSGLCPFDSDSAKSFFSSTRYHECGCGTDCGYHWRRVLSHGTHLFCASDHTPSVHLRDGKVADDVRRTWFQTFCYPALTHIDLCAFPRIDLC